MCGCMKSYKLVFAIVQDADFQWMIEPLAVEILRKGLWSFKGIHVSTNNIDAYIKDYSEAELEAVRILNECRPERIATLFSDKPMKIYDFFQQLPSNEQLFKKVIQYLRNKTNAAIEILSKHNIPLFFKGKAEDVIKQDPIFPSQTILKVEFIFSYDQKNLSYQLRLLEDGKEIPLQQNNVIILNVEPCWLIYNQRFYRVQESVDGKKISPFLQKDKIVIPSSQVESYLKKFVAKILLDHDPIFSGITTNYIRVQPKPLLFLSPSVFYKYSFALQFDYQGKLLSPFSDEKRFVQLKKEKDSFSFEVIERDVSFEEGIIEWLKRQGLERVSGNEFLPIDLLLKHDIFNSNDFLLDLITFVNQNGDILKEKGIEFRTSLSDDYYLGSIQLNHEIKKQHDWFDLYIDIQVDGYTIPFSDLKKHILTNQREYILPDGKKFIIPTEWFSRFKDIFLIGKVKKDNVIEIKRSNAHVLTVIHPDQTQPLNVLPDFEKAKNIEPPKQFLKELRPYQRFGMQWFYALAKEKLGGCLSDDMGLGKTIQVLAFLARVKEDLEKGVWPVEEQQFQQTLFGEMRVLPSLIVVPLSLIHNWVHEILTTTPQLKYVVYTGQDRHEYLPFLQAQDIVLTTYGTLRNDIQYLSNIQWLFVILDESQYIKNPESKIYSSVQKLKAQARFVLTGTPIENNVLDLWAQLNFVNPGMLGDLFTFKTYFFDDKEDSEKKLKNTIQPFVLRRTKEQVTPELPPLTEKIHYCPLSDEQLSLYETKKSEIRNYLLEHKHTFSKNKTYLIVLSGLMKLRLIANHPRLVDKDFTGESGKFLQVIEHIKKVLNEDHKLIVFSQFVKHLQLYVNHFGKEGVPFLLLTGQTPSVQRQKIVEDFQHGATPLLFMSLRAGGFGLNLTAADYVFLLDPWWNPAVEKQAIHRTHRIGQDKSVIAYKFISKNTIEEKILKLQEEKKNIFDKYITTSSYPTIGFEEVVALLDE